MKIIVTHSSPDWDAITSVWILKQFLPGWENAKVMFVLAGERVAPLKKEVTDPIELIGDDEVIHVDTGLGPLDHHQTSDQNVCAASLCWEYVNSIQNSEFKVQNEKMVQKKGAVERIVKWVVELDHFKEVFWENPASDKYEFGLYGLLEGLMFHKPNENNYYVEFGMLCLDAELANFENRIFAEKEIKEKGKEFMTKWGKGIAIETINDSSIKLAQKMGYAIVVKKDPRKGFVRIKATPFKEGITKNADLTLVSEKLHKMDPQASWYLHVSKKMLLNGSAKNPKMVPTQLSLNEIVKVVEAM